MDAGELRSGEVAESPTSAAHASVEDKGRLLGDQNVSISHTEEEGLSDKSCSTGSSGSPLPALLASLQQLENLEDHALLPLSLHQLAEACFLEEDYEWAVRFLQLECLYHQRLLDNLATLQEQWESRQREVGVAVGCMAQASPEQEHMDRLRHICRTHQRPILVNSQQGRIQGPASCRHDDLVCSDGTEANEIRTDDVSLTNNTLDTSEKQEEPNPASPANAPLTDMPTGLSRAEQMDSKWAGRLETRHSLGVGRQTARKQERWDEEEGEEDTGQGLIEGDEDGDEDEDAAPQLVSLEDMAKQIQVEVSPAKGLVSILKRKASLDDPVPAEATPEKRVVARRVRFREPEDLQDQDEVGGASCLVLLLLCLVTVVMSLGGTALYCAFGDEDSSVCMDFSHNLDQMQRGMASVRHWFTLRS